MTPTRRTFLRSAAGTTAAGALLSTASPVSAHGKPSMNWVSADSSNFTYANRESDYDIRWYIVHVAQGSYGGTISWFQNPDANASTHYVIENDSNPEVTQMVHESDIAWHGGGQNYSTYSLGIEHEGHVGSTYWTDATYRKSARIAQWACETYGIPLTVRRYYVAPCNPLNGSGGVIGHHQVPESDCGPNDHTDPGSTWNWAKFEGYLRRYHLDTYEHTVTSADLSVRSGPGTSHSRIDVAPAGTSGTVVDGPVDSDGYRWYEISYTDGTETGWSAADWLPYSRLRRWHNLETRTSLNVRDGPGFGYKTIDTAPAGATGSVVGQPVDTDGYRWWKIDYDGGTKTGWSVDYYVDPVH